MSIYDIDGNVISSGDAEVEDDSITANMLQNHIVDENKLKNGFRYASSMYLENEDLYIIAEGYELISNHLRVAVSYPDSSRLCAFRLRAGHRYLMRSYIPYYGSSYSSLFTTSNPDSATNVNTTGWVGTSLLNSDDIIIGPQSSQTGFLCTLNAYSGWRNVPASSATVCYNDGSSYSGGLMEVGDNDLWLYFCALTPTDASPYITTSINNYIVDDVTNSALGSIDLETTGMAVNDQGTYEGYLNRYAKSLTGYAREGAGVYADHLYRFEKNTSNEYKYASGEIHLPLRALIIGDSITYAASNAGLENAWRKYISAKMNMYEGHVLAVSGTGIIKGAPYDWLGSAKTSENYDENLSGVAGIEQQFEDMQNAVRDRWAFSGSSDAYMYASIMNPFDIAIVALGTNDWSSGGTLGSASTLDDITTFYGAVEELYTYLTQTLNVKDVLFVVPFPRKDAVDTQNSASTPYYLWEMAHALAEIACIHPHMHVLDLTGAWYFNVSNTYISAKAFIDNVHITGWAHHLVTQDMAREIQRIITCSDRVTDWGNI